MRTHHLKHPWLCGDSPISRPRCARLWAYSDAIGHRAMASRPATSGPVSSPPVVTTDSRSAMSLRGPLSRYVARRWDAPRRTVAATPGSRRRGGAWRTEIDRDVAAELLDRRRRGKRTVRRRLSGYSPCFDCHS
ncbi:hypothetical protein MBEHAL_0187 [Halarchaeum acidiphilum MH1-52-1]|uniref:Uncharacterized protein n=1 Tax=Halarchaeum acidiphilum MH1-52-1 TaxID=1261545 RepID=U2YRS8_9EURY|nr:hypothetical protein MBEHAL_0187 [Halarchaeum acidiphilum MH1-52-1]